MAKVIVSADIGNANIKGVSSDRNRARSETSFAHQIKQIDITEYENAMDELTTNLDDYFLVNGYPYVVGASAARASSEFLKEQGEERYTPEYYGVLNAILMSKLLPRSSDVLFIGSFPPADRDYKANLQMSVEGDWYIENAGIEKKFTIQQGNAWSVPEPLAGLYNVILTQRGDTAKRARNILNGITLVIDGGGYTIDGIAIDRNASVDISSGVSFKGIAAQATLNEFIKVCKTKYKTMLKGQKVSLEQWTEALTTGQLNLRGLGVQDVGFIAQNYRNQLFEAYRQLLSQMGGAASFDTLMPTGGVSGLISKEITERLKHNNIVFADELKSIHMANARGLMAFMHYGMTEGMI